MLEVAYIGSDPHIGINRPINNLTADQIAPGDAFLNAQVPNPFVGLVPDGGARNTAPTIQRRELMRPRPQFGTINERLVPIGTLDYQAIQLSWNKRLTSGIHFQVNYTGARNVGATSVLNMGEAPFEEVTDTHRPHVLLFTGGWNLPSFESRGAVMKYVLGGWQVNASTFLRSGLTVNMPGSVDVAGNPVLDNPTKAAVQHLHAHGGGRAPELRAMPSSSRSASVPRTRSIRPATGSRTSIAAIRGSLDMSIFQNYRVTQRFNFKPGIELFNLTNAGKLPAPNTTVTSAQFGTVAETQSNDPRFVQIAFRLIF